MGTRCCRGYCPKQAQLKRKHHSIFRPEIQTYINHELKNQFNHGGATYISQKCSKMAGCSPSHLAISGT